MTTVIGTSLPDTTRRRDNQEAIPLARDRDELLRAARPKGTNRLVAAVVVSLVALGTVAAGHAVLETDAITTIAGGGSSSTGNGIPPVDRRFTNPRYVSTSGDGRWTFVSDGGKLEGIRAYGLPEPRIFEIARFPIDSRFMHSIGGITSGGNRTYVSVDCSIRLLTRQTAASNWVLSANVVAGSASTRGCGYAGDGGLASRSKLGSGVRGLAVDSRGRLLIADRANHRVRFVDGGRIETLAGTGVPGETGDGGSAAQARLTSPVGVAVDASRNVFIATSTRVRRVTPRGVISTVFDVTSLGDVCRNGSSPDISAMALDRAENIYVSISNWHQVYKVSSDGRTSRILGLPRCTAGLAGDGGEAGAATLRSPSGLALDPEGGLLLVDQGNARVRFVRNFPPQAELKASPRSGSAPLTVTLNPADSFDPNGAIVAYSYRYQHPRARPSSPRLGKPSAVTYTYTTPGTYTARLTVMDDSGATAVSDVTITVR